MSALYVGTGQDDTAAIQALLNQHDTVKIEGRCVVNGAVGLRIPSGRILDMTGARVEVQPNGSRCKGLETMPGVAGVKIIGGEVVGDPAPLAGTLWRIGLRIDSARFVEVIGTTFRGWRTDGIWIGGNTASMDVRVTRVVVEDSGRNHISVTNASRVTFDRCRLSRTRLADPPELKADPGAGIDAEPNAGESVNDLTVIDCEATECEIGLYLHPGHGWPGRDYTIVNNRLSMNRRFGLALNSVTGAVVSGNYIGSTPIGASIGGAKEETRASDVTFTNNFIQACPRTLILAGVRHCTIVGNQFPGGRIEAVGLGTAGDMVTLRNETAA